MEPADMPIEAIYQELGNLILQAINDDWSRAILSAEIEEEDNGLFYGSYFAEGAPTEERYFEPDDRVFDLFLELRRRLQKPGYAPWHKAEFTLQRNGRFDLDFSYPAAGSFGAQAA